ncbi:MAG: OmpH family outer membrane protein [Bacteroidota bacterium]
MKKVTIVFTLTFLTILGLNAQRFAFVDTEYLLTNIPAYKAAQEQINSLSEEWEKEIQQEYDEIETLYKNYQAEKVLLTEEMKAKREEEIIEREKAVKELQNQYFGREGELFQKRQELIKPVQDEIYRAVKEIATEGNYAVIFDSASGPSMLYTNPKNDVSDEVLTKLGYKN